tara:strand:- start:51833 stop:53272 length:1440 start_codon:yes stop_codon:yes gene_type:complete
MSLDAVIPVILCGGSGTRLWPLSRKSFPKQFLSFNFTENQSLLQRTQERTKKIKNIQDPILICNEEHRFLVAEQMRNIQVKPNSIILEPLGKNTAPAIAISAIKALEVYKDPNLLILSSDHQIKDEYKFAETIEKGIKFSDQGKLVIFGITPTSPEVGYGYIKSLNPINKFSTHGSEIDTFIEKPNKEKAQKLIKDNRFSWNSGIFLFKASVILDEIKKYNPEILEFCDCALKKNLYDLDFQRLDREIFEKCPNISIDVAVMEKTQNAYVLPLDAGWSDVGSWDFVWDISKKDLDGNVIEGNVLAKNTKNSFLSSNSRLISAIGLKDLIVVETNDAILIANKEDSQEVKNIVEYLKKEKISQGIEHLKIYRPWGNYESIVKSDRWQVKLLNVKPGEKLSLQKHNHRSEHWIIVSGTAKVEIDEKETLLTENQSAYIPLGSKHRLSNPGTIDLKIIEIQSGSYLGEDDIERFDDSYGRVN